MDQGIKRLLQVHPADVISMAYPGAEYLAPIATDVATEPQLVLDTLFRIRFQGEECAVNIEAQVYPDPRMPRRCFEYGSRASVVHGLKVLSVVLWLERHGPVPDPPYTMQIGTWVQSTWNFVNIEVYDLSAPAIVSAGNLGLLPLTPFMQGADVPAIERAAAIIKERASSEEASDLVSLLAVFMARFYGSSAAREMVRRVFMSTEILDTSPLYQEMKAEGRAEGRAEGLREAVRLALEGRFGALDADLLAALNAADEARLREVIAHVASDTLGQVRERLRQPAP